MIAWTSVVSTLMTAYATYRIYASVTSLRQNIRTAQLTGLPYIVSRMYFS
jgi:hypothetical protein